MDSKAGYAFRCVCCGDERPEIEATQDIGLNGPVCKECKVGIKWAVARLKVAGIDRPLVVSDLNPHVKARYEME